MVDILMKLNTINRSVQIFCRCRTSYSRRIISYNHG